MTVSTLKELAKVIPMSRKHSYVCPQCDVRLYKKYACNRTDCRQARPRRLGGLDRVEINEVLSFKDWKKEKYEVITDFECGGTTTDYSNGYWDTVSGKWISNDHWNYWSNGM